MLRSLSLVLALILCPLAVAGAAPDSGSFAVCQAQALTFAEENVQTNNQGQQECQRLLNLINDVNQNDCQVVRAGNRLRARLRLLNQVAALNAQGLFQQLQALVTGNNLLGDAALGLQITTNGQCQ